MSTETEVNKFYTIQEVANLLQLSHQCIRGYVNSGKLATQKVGSFTLVAEKELRKFLKQSR